MSVLKEQPYTPLDDKELKEVQKALKKECPKLFVRVVSQLRQQEHYLQLQRAHRATINKSASEQLYELAESVEEMESQLSALND